MIRRRLEVTWPTRPNATQNPAEHVLRQLFAVLVPDKPLSDKPTRPTERAYNWGVDEEYRNANGDGLLIAENCYGAVAGDGIETIYGLRIADRLGVHVTIGDYVQDTLVFELRATPELLDVATDAILKIARAAGMRLVRRNDAPD